MQLAGTVSHNSIVAMFFAARFFCVLLLPIALLLSNGIMLELRVQKWKRFVLLLAIGALPMTSWVFGYIQPDNLVFVESSLAVYLAMRARRVIEVDKTWLLLGLVLSCEFATKVQYFVATAVPVLAWLLICARDAKIPARKVTRELFLFSTPMIVLAGASWVYVAHQASPAGPLTVAYSGKISGCKRVRVQAISLPTCSFNSRVHTSPTSALVEA